MKMNKKKIIHIFHELKFSGGEIMYVDAAPIFQKKGCELMAMATGTDLGDYAPFFKRSGYKIFHKPIPEYKNYIRLIQFYWGVIKLLKKEQIDVVHIHSHGTMLGMSFAAWVVNAKSICTLHSVFSKRALIYPYHFLMRWVAKRIFKCQFQTISDSVYDNELNLYHNKTTKIYNWYSDDRYSPAALGEKEIARKELGIASDAFVIISIGGCNHNKRHSDIIKALPHILEKSPNCLYLHLGEGISETEEKQLAVDLDLNQPIRFCGNQVDVRKYLIASDVYLMTSHFEGISITTIEAMACQIPAILYDVPGLRDFNKQDENSILIKEDYRLLAEKVHYLQENPKIGAKISISGKSFVDNNFNMQNNVNQIFELYI
jgi:glycosyltransferase involved in cell wall biosynthesis